MIHRKTPDLENKLLILFTLDQTGPLTSLQLLQFLAEMELMDYFTMQLTLYDLASTGHLQMSLSALGQCYALSAEGRESLSLFSRRLPHSIRSMVRNTAPKWKPRFQRETQILSEFQRREDGKYALRLRLMEKDSQLLDMTLFLPSRDLADWFSHRWPAAAPSFYGFLMTELGDNFSKDAYSQVQRSQGAFISDIYLEGCVLHLKRGESVAPELSLAVSLPDESMARFFAENWPTKADAICTFLMDRLTEEG